MGERRRSAGERVEHSFGRVGARDRARSGVAEDAQLVAHRIEQRSPNGDLVPVILGTAGCETAEDRVGEALLPLGRNPAEVAARLPRVEENAATRAGG